MKNTAIILVSVCIHVLFTGCNTSSHEAEIAEVQRLSETVEGIKVNLNKYDAALLANNSKEAKDQLDFISRNWPREDSLARKAAAFLSDYKANKKALGSYAEQIERMAKECDYTIEQLEGLRNDIANNIHSDEDLKKYLADENQAVGVLVEGDSLIAMKYDKILRIHRGIKPKVDSVILDMNQRGIR